MLHSWHFERLRESKHYLKILNSGEKNAIRIYFTLKIGISPNISRALSFTITVYSMRIALQYADLYFIGQGAVLLSG
jgi:hypothetical protein